MPFKRVGTVAVCVAVNCLLATSALAWGPGGHMIVARIAHDNLSPKARQEADRLCKIAITPEKTTKKSLDFVHASNWADDVKKMSGFGETGDEHFIDYPFTIDGSDLPEELPKEVNIVNALTTNVDILRNSADDNERARALRFIIHYVGDIHQPLHCAARVTRDLPEGDAGGNALKVRFRAETNRFRKVKLHSYWDGGINEFPKGGPDFAPPDMPLIAPAVTRAVQLHPKGTLSIGPPTNFKAWSLEGFDLAKSFAYKNIVDGVELDLEDGDPVTAAYNQRAAGVAWKQVALAGYRLAALLNDVFK